MSIHQSRPLRPINDREPNRPSAHDGAADPACPPPAGPDAAPNWARMRKAAPVNYMLPRSIAWLESLPRGVRPMALANRYPRIANLLALEWGKPAACRAYFVDLLVDRRGNRKGFPAEVDRDLQRLRDYYHGLHLTLDE